MHTFFTDELAPMAKRVLSILQESPSESEIDPKLMELAAAEDEGDKVNSTNGPAEKKAKQEGSGDDSISK